MYKLYQSRHLKKQKDESDRLQNAVETAEERIADLEGQVSDGKIQYQKLKSELEGASKLSKKSMMGYYELIYGLIERPNPILKKYYDDLEKAKKDKKVIEFKQATAVI